MMRLFIVFILVIMSQTAIGEVYTYTGTSKYDGGECSVTFEHEDGVVTYLEVGGEARFMVPIRENGLPFPTIEIDTIDSLIIFAEGDDHPSARLKKTIFGNKKLRHKHQGEEGDNTLSFTTKLRLKVKNLDDLKYFSLKSKLKVLLLTALKLDFNCRDLVRL